MYLQFTGKPIVCRNQRLCRLPQMRSLIKKLEQKPRLVSSGTGGKISASEMDWTPYAYA